MERFEHIVNGNVMQKVNCGQCNQCSNRCAFQSNVCYKHSVTLKHLIVNNDGVYLHGSVGCSRRDMVALYDGEIVLFRDDDDVVDTGCKVGDLIRHSIHGYNCIVKSCYDRFVVCATRKIEPGEELVLKMSYR